MRQISSPLPFAHPFAQPLRSLTRSGAIEWEELPSLADSLTERLVVLGTRHRDAIAAAQARALAFERAATSGQAWDATCPAEFEPERPSQPFREPLDGMAIREVVEPDVFRHFFGSTHGADSRQR